MYIWKELDPQNGLSTVDALQKLHDEIAFALHSYKGNSLKLKDSVWRQWFHHRNRYSAFHWTSVFLTLFCLILLLVAYTQQDDRNWWLLVETCIIIALLVANIYFTKWDSDMRENEIQQKIRRVLRRIKACCKEDIWGPAQYISLHSPFSPCVSLQWAMRDSGLVNLPCGLLVKGDVMYLRPGQKVPARCRQLHAEGEKETVTLEKNAIFEQKKESQIDDSANIPGPRAQKPIPAQPFVALETPYVENIKLMLEKGSERPSGVLCNERFSSYTLQVEWKVIPIVFVMLLFINILRYALLDYVGHWTEMFLSYQVQALLPFTALIYPIIWRLLELYGIAKVVTSFENTLGKRNDEKHEFESRDVLESKLLESLDRKVVWRNFKKILRGESDALPRTSSLIQTLGSVTDFCCVDKKGLLSWPNPTAEKVFFLRSTSSNATLDSRMRPDRRETETTVHSKCRSVRKHARDFLDSDVTFEVLDLSQNSKNGYGLQFDDPSWKRNLSSLKPLGLNILLNTCNIDTVEKYTEFADHVTCVAANHETTVPVVNRRCFCELSKAIGFTDQALDIFHLQHVLGLYRHLTKETAAKEQVFKTKFQSMKYRMPMPNVFSVIAREANSGISQLFSQGTGDLLLDTCSDYWDGTQVKTLSDTDRRRIADFYHRTSMSSYCTAFGYRPVTQNVSQELEDVYIELPEACSILFDRQLTPEIARSWNTRAACKNQLPQVKRVYHGSADSVMLGHSEESIDDVDSCVRNQRNQVFIGMISMQYQAKSDLVQLIEDLEAACIRFVHFSKENELRSRVFSEKMGLEAGWNCHISLLNEAPPESRAASPSTHDLSHSHSEAGSKPPSFPGHHSTDSLLAAAVGKEMMTSKEIRRRFTAPGAINLDQVQVKFESENAIIEDPSRESLHSCGGQIIAHNLNSNAHHVELEEHVHFNIEEPLLAETPATKYSSKGSSSRSRRTTDGSSDFDNSKFNSDLEHLEQSNDSVFAYPQVLGTNSDSSEIEKDGAKTPLLSKASKASAFSGIDYETVVKNTNSHNNMSDVSDRDKESDEDDGSDSSSFESYPPSSYITENTDSMTALGLSNRARLPKGIANIRPHIEKVDNVPLLVSLFTDCLPDSTTEMIKIMQEYGEVICCLGSSANIENTRIFLQADCTLGVEPLYPQLCQKYPVIRQPWVDSGPTPMELNTMLHNIPCALSFNREENVSVLELIGIARQHCQSMRNTFVLVLMFEMFLTSLHILSAIFLQPPPLACHHVMWLAWVVAPLLSVCNMTAELDKDIMKNAQGKNVRSVSQNVKNVSEFLVYCAVRILPSIFISIISHSLTLYHLCQLNCDHNAQTNQNVATANSSDVTTSSVLSENMTYSSVIPREESESCNCNVWFGNTSFSSPHKWGGLSTHYGADLALSQNVVAFQIVLYFLLTSMCLMHRRQHLWRKSPFNNRIWIFCSLFVLLTQIIYFTLGVTMANANGANIHIRHVGHVPAYVIAITFIWPLITVPIHELVKRREIRYSVRYQKRARLDFGTKLGMNSPF